MDKVRIGAVSYLNTVPLVYGMRRGLGADRVELSFSVPAGLSDRMRDGLLDVALLPVIELARMPELELVPGLGIVTRGPSRSVLLVARRPLDAIERVGLDPESRTSNALVQVLFAEVWGGRPRFDTAPTDLTEALDGFDAVVRIGDKALFEPLPSGVETHDLGGVWTAVTGLPFVFAAWAARPGVIDRELYRILHDSRREGVKNLDRIVDEFDWNGERDPELAREYLRRHILFRLGSAELEALRRFLDSAHALGLIDAVPEIRLAQRRDTACHRTAAALDDGATTRS
jgi:chorismate dehydratase